jgi:hypothetical protein
MTINPTTAPTIPTPPTTPTRPAAPVAATSDADAEVEVDTLALLTFSSAAVPAKDGTVLTHDLVILILAVAVIDPVDPVDEVEEMGAKGDEVGDRVDEVVVGPVEFAEDELVVLREVMSWEVDAGVEVQDTLEMVVEPW